jgi:hypothetical protein
MYKLLPKIQTPSGLIDSDTFQRISDNSFIVFNPANPDYQRFKTDLTDGVELNDAEGTPMTVEQIAQFLSTLP